MRFLLICCVVVFTLLSCKNAENSGFVKVKDGKFEINNKPYYFIGANLWYGTIIASKGEGGNRERLLKELDLMQKSGINNIRVQVGAEGPNGEPFRVTPALQLAPGVYNDTILDGLDFLLTEMKKRGQYAILFLQNSWDWSGGYAQYVSWNGFGKIPYPNVKPNTWNDFMTFASQFHNCAPCKQQFYDFITHIVTRTNRYSNIKYTDDASIMAWEIGNEPRAFGDVNIPAFEQLMQETSALLKKLDPNHLVTTGTEGQWGCENSIELFERVHADKNIDYLTMHIWPKNWGWLNINDIEGTIDTSILNTNLYMDRHIEVAKRLNKPLVLEEFGLPRDKHGYSLAEPTTSRDKYYANAFTQILAHAEAKGVLAGCNIWSWSGTGRPVPGQVFWKRGDCYLGDPPCEEQGLNSVFDTDATVGLITKSNNQLSQILAD